MCLSQHNVPSTTQVSLAKCQRTPLTPYSHYVYLATDGERVKVGRSATPHARIRDLRRKRPGLRLVRVWGTKSQHDAHLLEQIIHGDVMGRKHLWDGEWYAMPADEAEQRIDPVIAYWLRYWKRAGL
jgi:hypothetical protein